MSNKILVTGATGHLGNAVIAQLMTQTSVHNIVGLARDENKAKALTDQGVEVRYGNFDDRDSLALAMAGIHTVLVISTIDHHRYQQHKNVVDAAKSAGVSHIAYTSALIKEVEHSPVLAHLESHFKTEDYIKASGMTYSIFRNTLYADVIPIYVGTQVFDRGIYLPAGDGRVAYALRREMGEAIANVLVRSEPTSKTYELTGSELYSYSDVAGVLSKIAKKTVTYTNANPETFPALLQSAGVPDRMIMVAAGFTTDIRENRYQRLSTDLEQLLHRKPLGLEAALREIYNATK